MPAYVSTLLYLMALGTAALDVVIVLKLLAICKASWRAKLASAIAENGLLLVFVLSTLAVAGTLLMQFAGGLNPCDLCWWQRIFMYPIPVVSLIALVKGKKFSDIADYVLAFSFVGAGFALYQHLLQVLPQGALIPCDPTNDCAIRTLFYFNFVTIPWMALTVFVVIFLVALFGRKERSL